MQTEPKILVTDMINVGDAVIVVIKLPDGRVIASSENSVMEMQDDQ